MTHPKIVIVIVNWNGKNDTLECLHSIQKITYPNFETVIVDNGSSDDSIPVIKKQFPEISLISNNENLGFAGGNNIGMKWALENGADFVFLLNNDTVVDSNILDAFYLASLEKPKAGIFGATILRYDKKEQIDHLGGMWDPKKADFFSIGSGKNMNDSQFQEMSEVDYVCGCAFFIRKSVIEKIGYLENRFFLIWEESDYCYMAKKANFSIWAIPKAKLWHKISSSFVGGKPHTHYYWWRNRLLWIERNCSSKEKRAIYFRIIIPQMIHLFKIKWLKSIQLFLIKRFHTKALTDKRWKKFMRYKAGCKGIIDYFFRRFGEGPSWLLKKKR